MTCLHTFSGSTIDIGEPRPPNWVQCGRKLLRLSDVYAERLCGHRSSVQENTPRHFLTHAGRLHAKRNDEGSKDQQARRWATLPLKREDSGEAFHAWREPYSEALERHLYRREMMGFF
jgi:hypothetical protein